MDLKDHIISNWEYRKHNRVCYKWMHVRGKTENKSTKPLPYTWPETKHPSIIKTREKRDTTGRHDKEMPTEGR